MNIQLPIRGYGKSEFVAVVEAEIVDVAPHLPSATWAVHRCDAYEGHYMRPWVVSNIETGCCLRESRARSKSKAIADARATLSARDDTEVRKVFRKLAA